MKQIYILLIILFSVNTYSQNCNIGNETTSDDFLADDLSKDFLLGVKFTLAEEGTLTSMNLVGNDSGSGVQMAVYEDLNNVPNNLIASSDLGTVASGVTSLPVAATLLPAGDYWIMAVYEDTGAHSNFSLTATGNPGFYKSVTYGSAIPTNGSDFTGYSGIDFLYFLEIDCGNSQNCNIGNETTSDDFLADDLSKDFLLGVKFTLAEEGTLTSMNLVGNDSGSGVQMAVYEDLNNVPNNLIASSDLGTVASGVTSLPVAATLLPAGDYWIMAVYEDTGAHSNFSLTATGNPGFYKSVTYGSAIPTNGSDFTGYSGIDFLYFLEIDCGGSTLSINSYNTEVSIFPNPASDFITISNQENIESFIIINQLGQKVLKGINNNEEIDVRSLKSGLYFLKFENGNAIKFIKK
ncbi:hypothetical protein BTO04_02435 [Polaribacter sp. SA4-10]|uniref:T9SS type A sorting domain-containing protein n=1 Tax=Polaribacter sp. SA4-10 TaxID=754397 RepID=UPI000B3C3948|nr:T9SS type A sorting domain-containing protein [Polaribacter sp. SA4-10]ARV05624.1 hypothetical protein BTO04_02435 [Polaribacter sp. SA4-10]